MPVRNGSGLIVTPSLPALTSTLNVYICYGQSNSDGTNGLMPVSVSDPTYGAALVFGQDGCKNRSSGNSLIWTDLNYPPSVLDFTGLANTELQEPLRVYTREVFFFKVADVLNRRQIAATGQRHSSAFMCLGHTGYTMAQLIKGTNTYTNLINGVTKLIAVATALGYLPVIKGVFFVQGEANFADADQSWATTAGTLQGNINTDMKAITSQAGNIPMFITQQSNFSNNVASGIPNLVLAQLTAHTANPGNVILASPMYAGETDALTAAPNDLHFNGHQSSRWSSGFGNAVASVVIDGATWNPIRPKTVTRSGNVITMQFWVPKGPLILDANYVTNTTDGFYGFDFHQTGGTTTLTGVAQTAPDTLQFTLSGAPDGTSPFIRAGRNSANANVSITGPRSGARTCLRDSADQYAKYCNWCVHFDQPIT